MPVLIGGGIAATFDIVYACVRQAGYGRSPEWTLQSVASGWLGNGAFEGGAAAAALGLVSHYAIMLVIAAVYWHASRRVAVLRMQPLLTGALFGILVYLCMNFVVLPLSAFPFHIKYTAAKLLEGFASHAVFIGIPIALAVRRFDGTSTPAHA
jgi:uncharacterized membrane protein YagU involved in acid resistance